MPTRVVTHDLGGGADHAQDPVVRCETRKVLLLNRTQRLRGRRIAGKDDQRTSLLKEPAHRLQRVLMNGGEGAMAIGCTSIIA